MNPRQDLLRRLPAIDRLLGDPALTALETRIPQVLIAEGARQAVDELRQVILCRETVPADEALEVSSLARRAAKLAQDLAANNLRPVINLTGTVLHTNLGRAPLAPEALEAMEAVSRAYSNLEFDLDKGLRGHRYAHVEELLRRLTSAEAATVVNNNAGAVLLALTALARGREAVVSRGELVEIGGAFRIPEVMEAGGVILREVGATNKTHLKDYRAALCEQTALLLKVHTSNFRILGFTAEVPAAELTALARENGLPVMEDLGSGMLLDLSAYGLPREPTVAEAVAAGIDVVTFSGDKLLGGPQAGIIVGRQEYIEKIRRHPMARALRSDKLTLAALEATLRLYLDPAKALERIPVLAMLSAPPEEMLKRCRRLKRALAPALADRALVEIVPEKSTVGGGALPLTELPGYALALSPRGCSVDELAARLRRATPAVIARIQEGRMLLDPRTLTPEEEKPLVRALAEALSEQAS